MNVRRAVAGDEPILRAVRLAAMTDAPDAFGSTYAREVARTDPDWTRWLSPGATFLLDHAGQAMGIVAGMRDETETAVMHLMAMWVHPELRGTDAADALVGALISWARAEGATVIRLQVVQANGRARHFYERQGFTPTGHHTVRDRDGAVEIRMERMIVESVA